ncbi:alkaline phosphatase synthesis sensor protein PhoR [Clostridium homopropionicum DSM 5847]|uniref:histidine kinase n=1 Tax=Clostridium homopropionicum DSM 5847 TaxID=1121318 RepID=A0A0L6Z7P9_9CLOT|nr:HAMP domain-containing sensor histidine kinase [Clostridium homopropionicum]KOA18989.1 alkaline phosphatase synthesis sensor protein PhoR [Clostridium homopropionicum DSM 5847]SFG42475.1 Signal transduction histidine kinase [Clostridium homopropionicum]
MKNISLLKKLLLSFFIVIVGSYIITSIMANKMIDKSFNSYLENQLKEKSDNIIKLVEKSYDESKGIINIDKESLNRYAEDGSFDIVVKDIKGNTLYSSGNGYLMGKGTMGNMMKKHSQMMKMYNFNTSDYVEEEHQLYKNNAAIGTISIGYLGNYNPTVQDMEFRGNLNSVLLYSVILAILFGLIMSLILSKQITTPLVQINKIANEMKRGNFNIRSKVQTSTLELNELSQSMNYLAEGLQMQEALRKRLTSDMAHELRTPLTTLLNYVEGFIDGVWQPTGEKLNSCHEEILRLTKLVERLQDIAKLEQANLVLNKSSFNLSIELKKVVEVYKPFYSKKKLTLIENIHDDLEVFMDKDKIKQIIYNLLSNAFNYSNEKGEVVLTAYKKEDNIVISVQDKGIGIAKKDLSHIFERFYRADKSRTRETGGTGIGLTIVKSMVEAHGGTIKVESKLGEGSIFTIVLPVGLTIK